MQRRRAAICLGLILTGETISLYTSHIIIFFSNIFHGHFTLPADLLCFRANALAWINPTSALQQAAARVAPYMYPPPFMLLNAAMAQLSPFTEFCAWTVLSTLLLIIAGRCARLSWRGIALGLVMPANLFCIDIGESGSIVSALLAISLGLAETRPILAGIAAAALVIKPQFGLLLPFCFLASRNFRALNAAITTTIGLCTLTTFCFGPALWIQFFTIKIPLAAHIISRPWPHPFWTIAVSSFFTMRRLGAGLDLAYAIQSIATLAAIITTWQLWRTPSTDKLGRLAATLCLAAIATPSIFTYDLTALSLVLAGYAIHNKDRIFLPLAGLWFCSGCYIFFSIILSPGGILLPLLLMKILPKSAARSRHEQTLTPSLGKFG